MELPHNRLYGHYSQEPTKERPPKHVNLRVNEMGYIHTLEYALVIKRNEVLTHATTYTLKIVC